MSYQGLLFSLADLPSPYKPIAVSTYIWAACRASRSLNVTWSWKDLKKELLPGRAKEDFMQPIKLCLPLEEILKLYINNTTQYFKSDPAMWVPLPSSALSQLASQLYWVGEIPVNHPDLNDPKGPASLGLGQFWTSFWLVWMGLSCAVCVCVCFYVCSWRRPSPSDI